MPLSMNMAANMAHEHIRTQINAGSSHLLGGKYKDEELKSRMRERALLLEEGGGPDLPKMSATAFNGLNDWEKSALVQFGFALGLFAEEDMDASWLR